MKSWINSKLEHIRWGFEAIFNAIYFRSDLEDNIDRCAFFYELNCGWYEMNNLDVKHMTYRAQQIMDVFYKKYPDLDRHHIDNECVADVIREVANRLCTDWAELQHPADVLGEIANELEAL